MIGGITSTKWFFVYLIPGRIGIWKCWFLRRGENQSSRRKTSPRKGENQQQVQPTYGVDARIRTRATLVGGGALSPLRHPLLPAKGQTTTPGMGGGGGVW